MSEVEFEKKGFQRQILAFNLKGRISLNGIPYQMWSKPVTN